MSCPLRFALFAAFAHMVAAADFPAPYNSEKDLSKAALPAAEAAAKMKLPPGFRATVFASEPDVQNPIAMSFDARGRLWVAENYTYAERAQRFDLALRDRVLIFEDKGNDGHFDQRTVFTDDTQMLTSIEVGHGGVWMMCPPRLLFVPDANGDDVPDAPAQVVLDGFTVARDNYHNFANGLRWGPDGWLYGRCGASCPGSVGKPGTPDSERVPIAGGVWRFHPQRGTFEVLCHGTTNPWGHDWDARGEAFFVNTVNGHLWHMIPGARYVRPHTRDPNPRAYGLIDMHADHWHFDTARSWTDSRDGKADSHGGGHSHQGAMIYNGDNWPAEYRGKLFTLNFHGRRANQETLERAGSGFVAKHAPDFFVSADPWFRGIDLRAGPDGGVYVLDWSDTGECHENTGVHRTSGRIFKITHESGAAGAVQADVAKMGARELIALLRAPSEWHARQARVALATRHAAGEGMEDATRELRTMFAQEKDPALRLRALWSLHAIGATDGDFLRAHLRDGDESVRAWTLRLLTDEWPLDTLASQRPGGSRGTTAAERGAAGATVKREGAAREPGLATGMSLLLTELARTDASGLVRLVIASTLQRLPVAERADLAAALVARGEDASDHNLPLLVWFGLIPVAESDPMALVKVAAACQWPQTRQFIARRLAEDIEKNPEPLNALLALVSASEVPAFQADILNGVSEALGGWRKARKPSGWAAVQTRLEKAADAALGARVRELSAVFGDGRALEEIRRVALDAKAPLPTREAALGTLIESRPDDLRAVCERLLGESPLNATAARGLALFDDPAIGETLVKSYRKFHQSQRPQIVSLLVSRPAFARTLLAAVAKGDIPRTELSAFHVRQIRSLNDAELTSNVTDVWGELRDTPAAKRDAITAWKARLTPDALARADKSAGRAVFAMICAACHTLYGEGGKIGPDLTGSGRDNLDYLLENIVDPSAAVSADFRMTVLKLKDGRVLNGALIARTDRTVTLRSATETVALERSDIARTEISALSQMPEGLLDAFTPEQVRDLIAYLQHPNQVPIKS